MRNKGRDRNIRKDKTRGTMRNKGRDRNIRKYKTRGTIRNKGRDKSGIRTRLEMGYI